MHPQEQGIEIGILIKICVKVHQRPFIWDCVMTPLSLLLHSAKLFERICTQTCKAYKAMDVVEHVVIIGDNIIRGIETITCHENRESGWP